MTVTRRLDEVCTITMGQAPPGDSYNTSGLGLPLIAGAGDFDGDHPCVKKFTSAPSKECEPGDIVLGIRASIGSKVLADDRYCLGRGVAGLRAGKHLHDRYLWHWLTSAAPALAAKGRGATFLQVNRGDIGEMPIVVPPLDEQHRIAAILDQADALRTRRRQSLALLEDLPQSIFLDMFSGSSWPVQSVEEIASPEKGAIRTGPFGSQLLHSEFVDEGIAVLGIDNVVANRFRWAERRYITSGKYEKLKRYTVAPGDVLITIMGTCGRCVVVPADIPTAINTKHICAITVDRKKVLPDFVRACFLWHPESQRFLLRRAKGSIMDGLNMGIIKEMPMPVAPLELQLEFVQRVRAAESRREAVIRSSVEVGDLLSSLQQRAFSGRL